MSDSSLRRTSQTPFLHREDRIPVYENLCFSLSLFRCHKIAQVEEGMEVLSRLLGFFAKGFPSHLHDYPNLGSSTYQVRCTLPLHWILILYARLFNPKLREDLRKVYQTLVEREKEELPPLYRCLLSALRKQEIPVYTPRSSYEWGLLLAAYQIADEKPAWILEGALANWDPKLMTYSGSPTEEYQNKKEPRVTLYDFFMAEYQKKSPRVCCSIQSAYVFPYKTERAYQPPSPSPLQVMSYDEKWSSKGFHSVRFLWGSCENIRSLVCQDQHSLSRKKEGRLLFSYPKEIPHEKERLELALFTEYDEEVEILVEGKKQTLFYLGERLEVRTPEKRVNLRFVLEKGRGEFTGHILRGNRPSQIGLDGKKDFSSYDWKIGLRSIDRTQELTIGLDLF